jgi:hypothetical protein
MDALIDKPMPETTTTKPNTMDLKSRLVDHLSILKRPNDLLRVSQVSGHHFRVNTLSLRNDPGNVVQTYHIVKSQFLHVEDCDGKLTITDKTRR